MKLWRKQCASTEVESNGTSTEKWRCKAWRKWNRRKEGRRKDFWSHCNYNVHDHNTLLLVLSSQQAWRLNRIKDCNQNSYQIPRLEFKSGSSQYMFDTWTLEPLNQASYCVVQTIYWNCSGYNCTKHIQEELFIADYALAFFFDAGHVPQPASVKSQEGNFLRGNGRATFMST